MSDLSFDASKDRSGKISVYVQVVFGPGAGERLSPSPNELLTIAPGARTASHTPAPLVITDATTSA